MALTQEQQEAIARQFGEVVENYEHEGLGLTISQMIQVFGNLDYHRKNRHVAFFWEHYSSFKNFDEGTPLDAAVEHINLNGGEFDMFNYFSIELIQSVFAHLAEVKNWDIQAKMIQYYTETGQTETLIRYKQANEIELTEEEETWLEEN